MKRRWIRSATKMRLVIKHPISNSFNTCTKYKCCLYYIIFKHPWLLLEYKCNKCNVGINIDVYDILALKNDGCAYKLYFALILYYFWTRYYIIFMHSCDCYWFIFLIKWYFALITWYLALIKLYFALIKLYFALIKLYFALIKLGFALIKLGFALIKSFVYHIFQHFINAKYNFINAKYNFIKKINQ